MCVVEFSQSLHKNSLVMFVIDDTIFDTNHGLINFKIEIGQSVTREDMRFSLLQFSLLFEDNVSQWLDGFSRIIMIFKPYSSDFCGSEEPINALIADFASGVTILFNWN